jgi:hypothetical protein
VRADAAAHALSYVTPSHPHTAATVTFVQELGTAAHVPGASSAPHCAATS